MMTNRMGAFQGFKPQALQRIANSLGYRGNMAGFEQYLYQNPDKKQKMDMYTTRAVQMANGGMVKRLQEGGDAGEGNDQEQQQQDPNAPKDPRVLTQQFIPQQTIGEGDNIVDVMKDQAMTPGLPTGTTVVPVGTTVDSSQLLDTGTGQVTGTVDVGTQLANTYQASTVDKPDATLAGTTTAGEAVKNIADETDAQTIVKNKYKNMIDAQEGTESSVSDLTAAQGEETLLENPVQREIQDGELISGAANASKAAKFTEQIEAATALPSEKATVAGQLSDLMDDFEGGKTPAWAAGAIRAAQGKLAARGLGASSMAGQAIVQAAMESALPIAQSDAATQASFEAQNLSNRQARAMLAAEQRAAFMGQQFDQAFQARVANAAKISDIANMNFNAEQQIALENSRAANSMDLANLSNKQALVIAEASALSGMDLTNLNNRQQAAVQNAQNFLQVDMANLSNKQQVELFQAQSRIQSLFNDQAALNASEQFNATSQNQVDQFFANLSQAAMQFNASQANAQDQFNAGQLNTVERFNAELNNQRDQFNAENRLRIDQSNATWRREIGTADTAAVNRANELNASALLGYSSQAYNNLWQYYADNMEWAWTAAENEKGRFTNLAIANLNASTEKDLATLKNDYASSVGFGSFIGKILTTDLSSDSIAGRLLGGFL